MPPCKPDLATQIRHDSPDGIIATSFRNLLHQTAVPDYKPSKPRPKFPDPEGTIMLVAETDDPLDPSESPIWTGCLSLIPLHKDDPRHQHLRDDAKYSELKRMIVLPEYQGSGVAKVLMDAVEREAREDMGVGCIVVETIPPLKRAMRFYEKCGYVRRGVFGAYDEESSVFYEKWL